MPNRSIKPVIGEGTYISEHAVVIGNVTISDGVFIAPNATIRCDEPGSSIIIERGCNVQDNVVIHGLAGSTVRIGAGTSIGHGSIVHGPCIIGERCFVGFGAVLFGCEIGDDCAVLHRAVVIDSVIPSGKMIPIGAVIEGEGHMTQDITENVRLFAERVKTMNVNLAMEYLSPSLDREN